MDKGLREEFKKAFEAPEPERKYDFLNTIPQPPASLSHFIKLQLPFIKKSVWILSALGFIPAIWCGIGTDENVLWIVSAFLPLAALLLVIEGFKSEFYGMGELETATRYSRRSVILARIIILGMFDFILFCGLVPLCEYSMGIGIFRTTVYIFTPYILTAGISLWIVKRFHQNEAIYGCVAGASVVSIMSVGLHFCTDFFYLADFFMWWVIVSVLMLGIVIKDFYQVLREAEGIKWNLLLTD